MGAKFEDDVANEATAIGTRLRDKDGRIRRPIRDSIQTGTPPLVLQAQAYAFIPLESPEELRQWEADARKFYGVDIDASQLAGHACETCSAGCTDDCGIM